MAETLTNKTGIASAETLLLHTVIDMLCQAVPCLMCYDSMTR